MVEIRVPMFCDTIPDPVRSVEWPDDFPLPPNGTQVIGMGSYNSPILAQTPDNRQGYVLRCSRLGKLKWRRV